jgi:hypothetical protein
MQHFGQPVVGKIVVLLMIQFSCQQPVIFGFCQFVQQASRKNNPVESRALSNFQYLFSSLFRKWRQKTDSPRGTASNNSCIT